MNSRFFRHLLLVLCLLISFRIFRIDVNLSVTMTILSSVASFGMTTFWAYSVGTRLSGDKEIEIPYNVIAGSLWTVLLGWFQ